MTKRAVTFVRNTPIVYAATVWKVLDLKVLITVTKKSRNGKT